MDAFKNFAKATVSTGYDAAATSIDLTAGHGARFASVPFNAVWWNSTDYPDPSDDPNVEVVRVTAIASDTLTITRAQEGTSATTKNAAGKTYKLLAGLTAKTVNELGWLAAPPDIYQDPASATTTEVIPFDPALMPQITEGALYGTRSYQPKAVGNIILVRVSGFMATGTASRHVTTALFVNTVATAAARTVNSLTTVNFLFPFQLPLKYITTSLDPILFTLRFGTHVSANTFLNRNTTGEYGAFITWEISEYRPAP